MFAYSRVNQTKKQRGVIMSRSEAKPVNKRKCIYCMYKMDNVMRCRRLPPVSGDIVRFPVISKTSWCWEWKLKP